MVRIATPHDSEAIRLIALLSWKQAYDNVVPSDFHDKFLNDYYSIDSINERMQTSQYIVITEDGYSVGFSEFQILEDSIFLKAIYVLPSHQRRGFGSRMIEYIEQTDINKLVYLDLENGNILAEKFCETLGFEPQNARLEEIFGYPLKRVTYLKK